jgi:hypothetical protein
LQLGQILGSGASGTEGCGLQNKPASGAGLQNKPAGGAGAKSKTTPLVPIAGSFAEALDF